MIQDIRFALRILEKNQAFTAIAIATLALGIGINTAAFTFFNAFVLRPLPIRDPDALVKLNALDRNGRIHNFSIAEYRDFAKRHLAIIERFGRFPHRNKVLGRESTPEERAFLEQPGSTF